jgi:hypothetical protein
MKENCEIDVEVGPLCALVLTSQRFVIPVEINTNSDHFSNYFCPLKNDFCYVERDVFLSQFCGRNIVISLGQFCKWKESVWWLCCPIQNNGENVCFVMKTLLILCAKNVSNPSFMTVKNSPCKGKTVNFKILTLSDVRKIVFLILNSKFDDC